MIRLLSALLALTLVAAPAIAADDGGFGSERFYDEAPAAFNDPEGFDPQSIEPAAGAEDTTDGQVTGAAGVAIEGGDDADGFEATEPASGTVIDMVPEQAE